MKLTANQLRRIISEEVQKVMSEAKVYEIKYDVVDRFGVVSSGSATMPAPSKREAERNFRADFKADLKKGQRLELTSVIEV